MKRIILYLCFFIHAQTLVAGYVATFFGALSILDGAVGLYNQYTNDGVDPQFIMSSLLNGWGLRSFLGDGWKGSLIDKLTPSKISQASSLSILSCLTTIQHFRMKYQKVDSLYFTKEPSKYKRLLDEIQNYKAEQSKLKWELSLSEEELIENLLKQDDILKELSKCLNESSINKCIKDTISKGFKAIIHFVSTHLYLCRDQSLKLDAYQDKKLSAKEVNLCNMKIHKIAHNMLLYPYKNRFLELINHKKTLLNRIMPERLKKRFEFFWGSRPFDAAAIAEQYVNKSINEHYKIYNSSMFEA